MNLLRQLRIGMRLTLGFGTILLLLLGMSGFASLRLVDIGEATSALVSRDWVKAEAAARIDTLTRANARRTMELFFANDPAHLERVRASIAHNKQAISDSLRQLDDYITTQEGRSLLTEVKSWRQASAG